MSREAPGPPPDPGPSSVPSAPPGGWPRPDRALLVAVAVSAVVTAVSALAPDEWASTGVGLVFLGVTWALVLRRDTPTIRAYGLSLGGVTEPEPIDAARILKASAAALGWSLGLAIVFFPPFWLGYRWWFHTHAFVPRLPADPLNHALAQLLVIGLPEEAFFRGYLQSALDGAWASRRRRILGAEVGPGMLLAAAVFAVGHVLTKPDPGRLAVFFPALVFGWLRARTRGAGASILFHAMCNFFSASLGASYGFA